MNRHPSESDFQEASTIKPTAPASGSTEPLAHSETIPFEPGTRPAPSSVDVQDDIDALLTHLADAYPEISYDPEEVSGSQARYLMGEELGAGAIGQVFEAVDQHLGRSVAIKILRSEEGMSRERLGRFLAEAQITAQLEHPTIVPVHEIGCMPEGVPYFAMKLVRGRLLSDIINELRVGDPDHTQYYVESRLLRRFMRLSEGVAYAHSLGVVHRDLKPSNIMIGEYGEVQIMDWGLAKLMGGAVTHVRERVQTVRSDMMTMEGAIAGTPAYMSPEQARGEQEKIGPASDIFALGLILAEILTRIRVFRDIDSRTTLQAVRQSGSVDLSALAPGVRFPPELCAIVRKCTMPNPDHRYASASDLADDIRCFLENRETSVAPDHSHRRVMKWTKRNPFQAGLAMGAGAAVLLAALLMVLLHLLSR